MFARLLLFKLEPGSRSTASELASAFDTMLKARKGFHSVTFLADDNGGEYGALTVYETREDAQAAYEALFSGLEQALSGIAKAPPHEKLFEVVEPIIT